jgi:TadE-like protein
MPTWLWFRFVAKTYGAEIAELAIVMPLVFTLILGIYSFGRAYNIYSTVTRAAQDAARLAATPVCANCSQPSCPGPPTQFPCDATVTQLIADELRSSNLDPNQVSELALTTRGGCPPPAGTTTTCTAPALPGTTAKVDICRDVVFNSSGTTRACGTTVSFQYQYEFVPVPFIRMNSFGIPARAQVRTEY